MNKEKKIIKMKFSISVIVTVIIMVLSFITMYYLTESIEKDKLKIESNQQKMQESINNTNDEIEVKENKIEKQESLKET